MKKFLRDYLNVCFLRSKSNRWVVWKRSFVVGSNWRVRVIFNLTFWRKSNLPVFDLAMRVPSGFRLVKEEVA